jgi:hypothetical protein
LEIEIDKRKNYILSRSKNKEGKVKEKNTSKSYDNHMVNEDVNDNELKNKKEPLKSDPDPEQDFTKPDVPGDELHFPFDTEPMRKLWAGWKRYRWTAYKARYPMMGEQADLQRLQGMTYTDIEKAILEAIAKNWKHLYPDHGKGNSKNGTRKTGITAEGTRDRLNSYTD